MSGTPAVQCRDVMVRLGGRLVLAALDLEVMPGRMVALLGASGAGKSTLLNALAGFVAIEAGEIRCDGRLVAGDGVWVPPERRRVGVVFQDYALWPHMTVRQIVAYPLLVRGAARKDAARRADAWLERLSLTGLADRRPDELSGGQQQRVGLARALIAEPRVLLCDEPTANLDAGLRGELPGEIRAELRHSGAAGVYVTHDPGEAFAVGDLVAVLDAGRILQIAPPAEVYSRPASRAVAVLTGPASFVPAGAVAVAGAPAGAQEVMVRPEWVELEEPSGAGGATGAGDGGGATGAGDAGGATGAGDAEGATDAGDGGGATDAGDAGGSTPARVREVRFSGDRTLYGLESDLGRLQVQAAGEPRWAAGQAVRFVIRKAWPLPPAAPAPQPPGASGG